MLLGEIFINWNFKGHYEVSSLFIHSKPDTNLESSIAHKASVQFSLCIHRRWWDCWGHVRIFSSSPPWIIIGANHKPHPFLNGPKPGCDEKMVSSLCEREKRSLTASVQLQNSQAAASFQHPQLLLLQSVTSLVNQPLFISKSYVKLCTVAFCPCTGKRRGRNSERPGKTKAEKPLKSFAWEIVLRSYVQGREEREIKSYETKGCHLGTNSFDLSISFLAVNNSF